MKYQAILFDLDGTLLGIDTDDFTQKYIQLLVKYLEPYGYLKETFVPCMWQGVKNMVANDGSKLNHDVFYDVFYNVYGKKVYDEKEIIINFYKQEFNQASAFVDLIKYAKELVTLAHQKADYVILATNPFFPIEAIETKLKWLGLTLEDFDEVTHYENSSFCKPNPNYYQEILTKFNVESDKCLMIGNDVQEDIEASLGFDHFLIKNYLIDRNNRLPDCPQGKYEDCIEFLKKL